MSDAELANVKDYYSKTFSEEYKKKSGKEPNIDEVLSKVSKHEQIFQYAFTTHNSNPLGEKIKLMETDFVPEYNKFHKHYHPVFKKILERFGLYDIFIIDNQSGNVVYTAFKELDFSTNLRTGPYAKSGLAKVFEDSQKLTTEGEFVITDFDNYFASYELPASFMATPIWVNGKQVATIAFQLPLDKIANIMKINVSKSETDVSFVAGFDGKLRSDIPGSKDYTVENSFTKDKKIYTDLVQKYDGKEQEIMHTNYDGKEVLSSFSKLKFGKLNWIIFSEIHKEEAYKEVYDLIKIYALIVLITSVIVCYIGWLIASKLSEQIEAVVENMFQSVHEVQNANQKLDLVSNKLIHSVDSQSSSITESAQAVEEITATLRTNLDSTVQATKISEDARNCATEGKVKIDVLIDEVHMIASSYDDIQNSIENNNKNMEKILSVINEIADKTKVINDIVFQTKLLSFNASVEAARAGEHGKGFAVVAEEVGNLAHMSGKAAIEIEELIRKSADEVGNMTTTMRASVREILNSGRDKVRKGEDVAEVCKDQLNLILDSSTKLDAAINQINAAIREQTIGIEEVNKAMGYLEKATHETSAMSDKTKEASTSLVKQAHALRFSTQELRKILGSKKAYDVDKPA